jgi:two-component system, LytTR family, response regulator
MNEAPIMDRIRTLIAEDEPVALRRLRRILENEPDIEVVAEAKNGTEAIREIRGTKPDLVCLDIQMPVMGGFEVIRTIGPEKMPLILFVTAYDKYALQAFDANALDYLLKPFSEDRFRKALDRVRRQIEFCRSEDLSHKIEALLQAVGPGSKMVRIMVKAGDRTLFLKADDIAWAEAAGNYVNLHSRGKSYLYRSTLGKLTEELGADQFMLPGVNTTGGARGSTFAGMPGSAVNITVDGMNSQDGYLKEGFWSYISPRQDAVQEVTVSTATPGSESSGSGAVQVKFVTRQGNNNYQGSLYWYHRNPALNTNYWFNNRDRQQLYKGPGA